MFRLKALSDNLVLFIIVNFLSIGIVKSRAALFNTADLTFKFKDNPIHKKIQNWIPIDNSNEIKKIYFFNVTNLDNYLNDESEKIEVNELEPIVYQSSYLEPLFLNFTSDEKTVIFHVMHSHTLDDKETKILNQSNMITRLNADSVNRLEQSENYFDSFKSQSNYTDMQKIKKLFENVPISNLITEENVSNKVNN